MSKVSIFYKKILAGTLEKTGDEQFIFIYDEKYLLSQFPSISLTLPKEKKRFESSDLFPFFDGLIPEGWLLNLATTELRLNPLRNRFELLCRLCHDTIGAIHVGEKQQLKERTAPTRVQASKIRSFGKCLICYEKCESVYHDKCMKNVFGQKITPVVDVNEEILERLAKNQLNQKLALAGVQKKLSLEIVQEEGKASRMTMTDLWGRFIFKPRGNAPHYPENEHLCLRLAEISKIKVEKSALIPTSDESLGFITKRFDRDELHNEYHQEDFCQIMDKAAYKKYNGSLEQVGKIIKQKSDFPGNNLYRLYELTIFNFIIGNVDAHLKNISLTYEDVSGLNILLSPAYDLLSTDLYINDDNEQSALAINGKKNQLNASDFDVLAKSFGISAKVHDKIIKKFQNLLPNWNDIIDKSFIEEEKKTEFKILIRKKLEIFF